MNYRITIDPVGIYSTGAAVDNVEVFGSLKMARAALDEAVGRELMRTLDDYRKDIDMLKAAWLERAQDLRAQRKLALKVREADLPSDATIPVLSPPPAAPAAAVSPPQAAGVADSPPAATENGGGAPSRQQFPPGPTLTNPSDDARAGEPTAGTGDADPFQIPGFLRRKA